MKTTCLIHVILWLQLCMPTFVESNYLDVNDIRLVDGNGPFDGRVEIQIDGVWGTVCHQNFRINDARVMCRMLGLLPTAFFTGAHFGQGTGPIFAQEFNCNGYESNIGSCTFESNVFCNHFHDVSIICSECGEISIGNGKVDSMSADGTILTISCNNGYKTDENTTVCQNGSWSSLICSEIMQIDEGFPLNISDIRLVNAIGIADGRVEILVNGTWGTICGSSGFYLEEAKVICNMLGFSDVSYSYTRYYHGYGQGTGPVHIANLECNGTETHINDCVYISVHSCSHYYDVAVVCKYQLNVTDIRLVDGTGPYNGRVEVYSNGIWGTACDRIYNLEEMEIFCKMLNLNFTEYFTNPVYGQGSGPILIGYLYCTGHEANVNNCTYHPPTRNTCNHYYDLTLVCTPCGQTDIQYGYIDSYNGSEITVKCNVGYQPEDYELTCLSNGSWIQEEICSLNYAYPLVIDDIKLVYKYRPSEGRVEILVDGVWGTICSNNFNIKSANVTCHMFGLEILTYYTSSAYYGQGSGPVYIDNLNCTGLESHINDCSYDVANTCTHSNDVSVICTGYQLDITDIRLAGTAGPYHGRIEVEVNGTWGTVGHDYFNSYAGRVVCHMLGLQYRALYGSARYGQGSGPVLIDRLSCPYSATHINQCRYSIDNFFNTQHYKDVSVICWAPSLNITEARLVNGTGAYDGRAEIKVNGTWGTICDSNFDILEADLFCNMLGLRAARFFTGALYGEGSGPVFIDQLYCDQYDADLSSCQYLFLNECSHGRDISVVCNECGQPDIYYWDVGYFTYRGSVLYADCSYYRTYVGTLQLTCDNGTQTWIKEGECQEYGFPLNITDIRLVDGLSSSVTEGRVELKSFETWGTICDNSFGIEEANAICIMIGYPPAVTYYPSSYFGEGSGPIFVDDLNCQENSSHINDCTYITYDNCDHGDDISVVCTECAKLVVDNGLVNSTATNYGATIQVTCDNNYKVAGKSIVTCQIDGTWSDNLTCAIIDCGDPTPEHGLSNASTTINGTTVSIKCNDGYNMAGDVIISCQENETWTDDPICEIKDCGYPSTPHTNITLLDNKTTYGETAIVSCWTGYILSGSSSVNCLSNGRWELMPVCTIVECDDPTPIKGSVDRNETTFGTVVEVSCDLGYNKSGNSTIVCEEDGTWSDDPVCDETDCGVLSVPNAEVDYSQETSIGSVATIECDQGYDIKGASLATCESTDTRAKWNVSAACEIQVCDDPTPNNGHISTTDGTDIYVFENFVEIECKSGYKLYGDKVITCDVGSVWSDNSTCVIFDCGSLTAPVNGHMDASQGTQYEAEIIFSCNDGFLLLGGETTFCGDNGEWTTEAPTCVAKSDIGGHCTDKKYCLFEDSSCIDSLCTCITGIYDSRTKKCNTMPLMPYGTEAGDVAIPKRTFCGPKVTFEPGFPIFNKMHTELYVCAVGYVSFDKQFSNPTPPKNKKALLNLRNRVMLAPFYGPIDRRNSGKVFYRSYNILDSYTKMKDDEQLISYIENIVMEFGNLDSFDASFVLIATWLDVKALGSRFDKSKTSTFQVVFVSDGRLTYAFYIYGNGKMQWLNNLSTSVHVWIGYTIDSFTYTHPYSFSNASLQMDAKLTISYGKRDVSGLVFRPLYSNKIKQKNNAAAECIRWYNENYEDKARLDYIASLTPECPCDIRLSRFDPWFWKIGLYRWRRDLKYQCVDMLHVGIFGHYGKSCCYDLNTWLWVYERPLAGSFQLYNERHPSKHKLNDEQPKENCCNLSKYCNLYYELRPTGSCYKTSPYKFGSFWGDPHFSTLDGMNYTFNGLGEYTMLQIRTGNCTFDLQARTERALKDDSNLSDATVFTAFAAKDSMTDSSIHVERNNERTGINLYGNAVDLTDLYNANTNATDPFVWSSLDNNLTIAKRNDSVNIFFQRCDISLSISMNVEMLSLSTFVPKHFKNLTKGLLGNYNGDATDDFTMPNGTLLQANLTEREIFAYGKTWSIDTNNAAFFYDVGKSHSDFHNETYVPRFLDEVDPLLIAKAKQICDGSNNTECVFDYVFTENIDVAEETKKIKGQSDADKTEIDETVPTLEGCSTVNVTRGQNASCKLSVGDGETVKIVSSNVSAAINEVSSTISFVPETDEPVTIRVAAENQNGRSSPAFTVSVILCTACNGHGVCTDDVRVDPRENEYFRYSTCECDIGYEGIDCESEYDGCAANPCSLDRNCTALTAKQQIQQNRTYICDPCPTGFVDDDEGECIDIDECSVINGGCIQNCTNTDGGYECTCNDGYRVDNRNMSLCRDINECEEATHNCDHICNNTEGGFTCECHVGYDLNTTSRTCHQMSDGSCSETEKSVCSGAHGCTKEDNSPVCFCKDGFELDSGGLHCQDIDECSRGVCQQECVNTNGSFECKCFTGYRLEGRTICSECDVLHWGENCANDCVCTGRGADRCDSTKGCICESGWHGDTCNEDINECENEVQLCEDPRKSCINNLGSYSCEYRTGFHKTDQESCEDTDECLDSQLNNCTQLCTNTIGSYSCGCRNGYTKYDEYSCKDINECELRTSSCEQKCSNDDGHYSCFCHFGYSLNDDRRTCSKISDPCLSIYNLTCSHFCKLENENAECGCKSGFVIESDHQTCTDINECVEDDQNKCNGDAACINTEGSFLCECPDGNQLENDGRTCTECDNHHYGRNCQHTCSCLNGVCDKKTGCICNPGWAGTHCDIDINECSTEQMVCLVENSVCVNLLGSALCSCENGYRNNSGVCQDINECDDVATNECDQICTNTEGSYTCSCQHGFIINGICTDIDECTGHHDCDQICENTVGSYRCSCEDGFRLNLINRKVCTPEHICSQEQNSSCPQRSTCSIKNDDVSCTCLNGYEGEDCTDVDECKTNINLCSHNCSNTDGSFSCRCSEGFVLLDDYVSCKECSNWRYGENCDSACSCNKLNTETCDSVTGVCACKPGWTGETCEKDIDECTGDHACPINSDCKNANGSFNCKCLKGYFKAGSEQCEECDFRHFGDNCLSDCLCDFENTEDCNHTTGECICNQGWTGSECRFDIDECTYSSDACGEKPYSTCMNTNGSFTCDCVVGFKDKNNTCEDINECLDETVHNCLQRCENIPGSFTCSCLSGFIMKNETCLDINECDESSDGCEHNCSNTVGSFNCLCDTGFTLSSDGISCEPCNMWSFGQNCESNCTCLPENTDTCDAKTGICSCKTGWNGTKCESDIDECENLNVCPENSYCENSNGSFDCICTDGFNETGLGECKDIDECSTNMHACSQNCTNTEGSYTCGCQHGFFLKEDNITCDVCEQWAFGYDCESKCTCIESNSVNCDAKTGQCICKSGWNGISCNDDVNECLNQTSCHINAFCSNLNGTYECICNSGYYETADGQCQVCNNGSFGKNCSETCTCFSENTDLCHHVNGSCSCKPGFEGKNCTTDIDECNNNEICLNKSDSFCNNTIGSFKCVCNDGYRDQDDISCQDIDECTENTDACSQHCTNTNGSFDCSCKVGYFLEDDNWTCQACMKWTFGENCQSSCSCNKTNTDICDSKSGHCFCMNGWNGTNCEDDINECNNETVCPQNSLCNNSVGSYACVCNIGYMFTNAGDCDVCTDGTFGHNCSEECECNQQNTQSCNHMTGDCTCKEGWTGVFCSEDIDECKDNSTLCQDKANSTCENTNGSYICPCNDGLREQGNMCTECNIWKYGQNCQLNCTCNISNSEYCDPVSGVCVCLPEWNGTHCDDDVDECEDENICPIHSSCDNSFGSFDCRCNTGYSKTETDTCQECDGTHFGDNCSEDCTCDFEHTDKCDHVSGSCSCTPGWTGDICSDDVNECFENNTSCDVKNNSTCKNSMGSFECVCNGGFRDFQNESCSDVDECTEDGHDCLQSCVNTVGGYLCECFTGYKGSGNDCTDVDECDDSPCIQICTNTEGSYHCICHDGYQLQTDNVTCAVCSEYAYGTNCSEVCSCVADRTESCNPVNGSCTCNLGWEGDTCSIDTDECTNEEICKDKPESTCENTLGSYTCACNAGYQERNNTCEACEKWTFGDNCQSSCKCNVTNTENCDSVTGLCDCLIGWNGTYCEDDINECENKTICQPNSVCYNSDGSYDCVCNNGFRQNGTLDCEECPEGTFGNNCSGECECNQQNTESCNHIEGNCTCKQGWTGTLCSEDINECEENSTLCESKTNSTCLNTNGSYSCPCNYGFREQGNMCTDCDIWKYGQHCQFNCTCNILKTEYCDPVTGVCNCLPEWNGTDCEDDANECEQVDICPVHSLCENSFGTFECKCDEGYSKTESKICEECTDNKYGVNCTESCYCNAKHSANEYQTCDTVTGQCMCKPNWKGNTCDEDVNECEDDITLCNDNGNETCVNTEGWYECDCKKGFDRLDGNKCVADMSTTTVRPDSALVFEAVVIIDIDLPADTNLNAANVYNSIAIKLVATLRTFFRRFTDVWLDIIINDISLGSIIANYTARSGTAGKDDASQLVAATIELGKGTELVYDRQTVNASSESFKGKEPCEVLYATVGSCDEDYTCSVDNGVPVCKLLEEQSGVNITMIIGLSAAGIFSIIGVAILFVLLRRLRGINKKQERNFPGFNNKRDDDEASDFYKSYKWQDGKAVDAGTRLPTAFKLPRFSPDLDAFNQPYTMRAKAANSPDDTRGNWF